MAEAGDGPGSLVREAADTLYRVPPDRFVGERTSLARAARTAGDAAAARAITALARPTRAAWIVNLLAREAPDVVTGLIELGSGLQAAQRGLDATALRELSDRRRVLVRDAARRAFELAGGARPASALAAQVQDTLSAVVVDPEVGQAVRAGTLLAPARASGFGPTGPALAAVPEPRRRPAPRKPRGRPTPRGRTTAAQAQARAAHEKEKEKEKEQRAQARERVEQADRAVRDAHEDLERAEAADAEQREQVRLLAAQLAAAERAAGDAGLALREARAALRRAERARRDAGT